MEELGERIRPLLHGLGAGLCARDRGDARADDEVFEGLYDLVVVLLIGTLVEGREAVLARPRRLKLGGDEALEAIRDALIRRRSFVF